MSQVERSEANAYYLERLFRDLAGVDRHPADIPVVFQCNKQDLSNAAPVAALRDQLRWPVCDHVAASARTGDGVINALRTALTLTDPRPAPPYR